jgi:hypothetical protein
MRFLLRVAAVAAAALAVAACDKPRTQSAYINSGTSATPAMPAQQAPAEAPSEASAQPMSSQPKPGNAAVSQAPAVSDTTSPSTAPAK